MASSSINGSDLRDAIKGILDDYKGHATITVQEAVLKVGKAGLKELKSKSAQIFGNHEYAKGWRLSTKKDRHGALGTIYHGRFPWLPHLLEKPHLLRNGKMSKAKPHIEPVEQQIIAEFQSEVEKGL